MIPVPARATSSPDATPLRIQELRQAYASGTLTPGKCVAEVLQRIERLPPEVWISRPSADALLERSRQLDALLAERGAALLDEYPLFGIPFAVKDNIDVAGLDTTAACPAFAFRPAESAPAVARLEAAHAICLGKTNLDQFATGLVGTRSPFGIVRNAVDPAYVAGGSSSGSAVAVALGLACFSLATDTAGSGRVPAAFNGIVGIKPSRGLVSSRGMVAACRTLDCVAVFANGVEDAWEVLSLVAGYDDGDAFSRVLSPLPPLVRQMRLGIPAELQFFQDAHARAAFEAVRARLRTADGLALQEVDASALMAAAELLYQGPWVAERRAALGDFPDRHAADMDPVVRAVILGADGHTAVDAFRGQYRLAAARRAAEHLFAGLDALLVPSAPEHPLVADVLADPIARNSRLGTYTNFVNLLDLAAVALPGIPRRDGLPAGITLIGPAGSDHRLAVLALRLQEQLGSTAAGTAARLAARPLPFCEPIVEITVVGAHLTGQPLNWQLLECGARCTSVTHTAPRYRLYALANTQPRKPGLARVAEGGAAIEVETWTLPARALARLMLQVASPLGIGTLELADGRWVKGFICEPCGLDGALDITDFGGWRSWLSQARPTA